jgi:DNA-directed RNA polymerase specialized sigma24 family protein
MQTANLQYLAPTKNIKKTADFLYPPSAIPEELEWMLQNSKVSNLDLAERLADRYYPDLYHLALILTADPTSAAFSAARALVRAVAERRQYWGQPALFNWLLGFLLGGLLPNSSSAILTGTSSQGADDCPDTPGSRQVQALLDHPRRLQLAFVLRYTYALSPNEIVLLLGGSPELLETSLVALYQQLISNLPGDVRSRKARLKKDILALWPCPDFDLAALAQKIELEAAVIRRQRMRWQPFKLAFLMTAIIAAMVYVGIAVDIFQPTPTVVEFIYVIQVTATPLP